MKKNEKNELKTKTLDELRRMLLDLRKEMERIKLEKVESKLKNPNAIRNTKHNIARVLTIMSIKQMVSNMESGEKEVHPIK